MRIPAWPVDRRGEAIKTAKARRLGARISPRKLNFVCRLIRGLHVVEAHRQLEASNKKSGGIIGAVLAAAEVNARAYGLRKDRLVVHEAYVGKGVYIRQIRPWHGKGRFGVAHKKYAHLTVVVRELDEELWDFAVVPDYMHVPRSKAGRHRDDSAHPVHRSENVSWVSDLDHGLQTAYENIRVLKGQVRTQIRTPTSE